LEAGLERYPDPAATSFRRRAAEVLKIDPDWILCGNGSDDILTILTRTFVSEGQLLRLPYPSYILYRTLADLQGARHEEISFRRDWTLPEEFGKPHPDLRLAFLANPNSPSGTMISPQAVLEMARQLPCPLVVDEAYVDFATANCLDLVRNDERIMVTRSLSKSYSLAGLRFGYLVAHPSLIAECTKVKDSYNCDSLSIAGATAAIDDQVWLAENLRRLIATRDRMTAELAHLGFSVVPSQANFVWCCADRPVRPIYENLKQRRILVRYMNYPGWGDGLRISAGTDEQIDALLAVMKEIL
jgi:histidinol-phosphate aminotransferase